MSLYKIPLICVAAMHYDRSFIAPQPPASAAQQKRTQTSKGLLGVYERIVPHVATWTRTFYWALVLVEIAVIIAQNYPDKPEMRRVLELTRSNSACASVGSITPAFLVGVVLVVAGGQLRLRCFREMGRHFTFALSLREDHKLIRTGPYSIVRHPAYTSGDMTVIGGIFMVMLNGSWWFGAGHATPLGMFMGLNYVASVLFCIYAFMRGATEDKYLRKVFGAQWDEWARNVPYRYVPGLA